MCDNKANRIVLVILKVSDITDCYCLERIVVNLEIEALFGNVDRLLIYSLAIKPRDSEDGIGLPPCK
jgi:hypothetical protein